MVNLRRSEFDIINEMLKMANDGVKRTELIYKGNLSYHQLQKYLSFLLEKDILLEKKVKNGSGYNKVYFTTEKGKDLLVTIKKMFSYME
jgi:predicted transcriptional regulator